MENMCSPTSPQFYPSNDSLNLFSFFCNFLIFNFCGYMVGVYTCRVHEMIWYRYAMWNNHIMENGILLAFLFFFLIGNTRRNWNGTENCIFMALEWKVSIMSFDSINLGIWSSYGWHNQAAAGSSECQKSQTGRKYIPEQFHDLQNAVLFG